MKKILRSKVFIEIKEITLCLALVPVPFILYWGWKVYNVKSILYAIMYATTIFLIGLICAIHAYIIIFISKKIANYKDNKIILDEFDKKNYKDYYRNLLNEYPVVIMDYIDEFEINEKTLALVLMYFKYKKYIDINDGKIERRDDFNFWELLLSERLIFNSIRDGKLHILDYETFMKQLEDDINKDVIDKFKLAKQSKIKISKISEKDKITAFKIFVILLCMRTFIDVSDAFVMNFSLVCLISYAIFSLVNSYRKGKLYTRTAKGKELNKKIEGLKNYLKDYSILYEKDSSQLEVWEEYLIYSAMFNQNEQIIKEYEKYIFIEKR